MGTRHHRQGRRRPRAAAPILKGPASWPAFMRCVVCMGLTLRPRGPRPSAPTKKLQETEAPFHLGLGVPSADRSRLLGVGAMCAWARMFRGGRGRVAVGSSKHNAANNNRQQRIRRGFDQPTNTPIHARQDAHTTRATHRTLPRTQGPGGPGKDAAPAVGGLDHQAVSRPRAQEHPVVSIITFDVSKPAA